MDPISLSILIGLSTLIVERGFTWAIKIKKSTCCNGATTVEMKE